MLLSSSKINSFLATQAFNYQFQYTRRFSLPVNGISAVFYAVFRSVFLRHSFNCGNLIMVIFQDLKYPENDVVPVALAGAGLTVEVPLLPVGGADGSYVGTRAPQNHHGAVSTHRAGGDAEGGPDRIPPVQSTQSWCRPSQRQKPGASIPNWSRIFPTR